MVLSDNYLCLCRGVGRDRSGEMTDCIVSIEYEGWIYDLNPVVYLDDGLTKETVQ